MGEILYHATPHAVEELMNGGGEFLSPGQLLGDLTGAQACASAPNAPHTIAQIVAHLHYFQEKLLAHLRGEAYPAVAHLEDTFAPIAPEAWDALREAFLAGVIEVTRTAYMQSDTVSPDRADTSLLYDLAENALHNAYHFGQIVTLRQQLGIFPPPSGEPYNF